MIVTGVRTFLPGECLPPHLWIWPNRFDNRRIVKYVYAHFTPNFTVGVFLIASSSETWYVLWSEYHGSARKTFPATVFAFWAIDTVVRYQTTSEMCVCARARARVCVCVCVYVCVCIIDWHCKRWCHCNRFSFLFMVFLKDKYDGSVVYVDLDMTICKQPQSYPCTL